MATAHGGSPIRVAHNAQKAFRVISRRSITALRLDWPDVRARTRSRMSGRFRPPVLSVARIEAASAAREQSGQLLLPFEETHGDAAAADRLLRAIPGYAREICCRPPLSPLATTGMLRLLAACESSGQGAIELAVSNPALAVAIAYHTLFGVGRNWDPTLVRRLVFARRAEILRQLGFPLQMERTLRRVMPLAAAPARLLGLRDSCWREPTIEKLIHHLPHITGPVIDAIGADQARGLLSFGFLFDLAARGLSGYGVVARLDGLVDAHAALAGVSRQPISSLPRLQSVRHLDRLVADIHEQYERERLGRLSGEWPTSPFPSVSDGHGTVKPLRSLPALVEQGEACHNCLAHDDGCFIYAEPASVGRVFLFDVTVAGERATLALAPDAELGWRVELRGVGNVEVSDRLTVWLCDYFRAVIGRDLLARPTSVPVIPF